jgi:hypothetical protein
MVVTNVVIKLIIVVNVNHVDQNEKLNAINQFQINEVYTVGLGKNHIKIK